MTRRRRTLTGDEQALWAHVTRHIAPFSGRPAAAANPAQAVVAPPTPAAPEPPKKPPPGPMPKKPKAAPQVKPPPPPAPTVPSLAPLERRLRQRLSRGAHPIDAVIDLHGMRQAEAHEALRRFLHGAQAAGHRVVLVVTGKGGGAVEGGSIFEERGVLRRTTPHWLRQADLRAIVVGFEEAAGHHGGGGALYVRLRRAGKLGGAW
ncbi:Smr/MutS family protein [Alsobacter sp. SYSU M60028]|uniref:Smr/MutS family protein n=1 Tax=Alsobacter ponti TaxID=2962936 RepID=A0ABT1LD47_9HYPH|nr:Smr/MutS family protein [Alsobacter ponti]MCP8938645.1 Smr/MutS family protein [Alsobacter ponti]